MEKLMFRAFRAVDEPETCAEFMREHRRVLEDFGITNVTTNTESWTTDPHTYVIVALSDKLGMVGGIRVQIAQKGAPLPMDLALRKMDPSITTCLDGLIGEGNAEVCGLWNANRFAARGLSSLLAFAAVSVANQLGVRSMVCLVAHYTLRHALKVGFTILEDLGDGGTFTYPIPSIKAIAMVIPDVITLGTAHIMQRQQLFSLRLRPAQVRIENVSGVDLMVCYDLCLGTHLIDMTAYRNIWRERSQYAETA